MRLQYLAIPLLMTHPCYAQATGHDWTRFGWDVGRSSAPAAGMGVTAANVATLRRQQVPLHGTVDASAIYLHHVTVRGTAHDVFFVTTTYGRTVAVDADSGAVLWEYVAPTTRGLEGSYQFTNATPVADPDRQFIYAASPDGMIQKVSVADGSAVWRTAITRLPQREKIASSLNFFRGRVIATTGGYIGDEPPYQGHVAILDAATGRVLHVWNSLCSDRLELIEPSSCGTQESAIWGRAGAVIDSASGNIFVATGNGRWDGKTAWGDAVIELDSEATRIVGNYTPTNTERLDNYDLDVGSTSPVLLGNGQVVQGGKDGELRLLDWLRMRGAEPHQGGESFSLRAPAGGVIFTAAAVVHRPGATWVVTADRGGATTLALKMNKLVPVWHATNSGTSPVVVDGLAFIYDPGGALRVYDLDTGRVVATLPCGGGHWNSPIVVDGRIALPEGDANQHATSGVLNIWRLP